MMEQNDETNWILKIGADQGNYPGRNEFGWNLQNKFIINHKRVLE